jgi:hypothetical protein
MTVVRTLLTQSILNKEGKPGLQQLTQEVPNAIFTPERGVLQGDTCSSLIWLLEYDILLRALTIQRNRLQDPGMMPSTLQMTSNLSEAASIHFFGKNLALSYQNKQKNTGLLNAW